MGPAGVNKWGHSLQLITNYHTVDYHLTWVNELVVVLCVSRVQAVLDHSHLTRQVSDVLFVGNLVERLEVNEVEVLKTDVFPAVK